MANKEPEKTVFIDQPGKHPTDDMLAGYRQRLAAEPGPPLEEDEEEDDLLAEDEPPSSIEKRLATLEAENQRLRNNETTAQAAGRQQQIASWLNELTEAARYGDDARVQQARQALDQLAQSATALPSAPPGHWSNDVANLVQRWKAERPWLGRDAARMQAMQQVGGSLDPARYPTAAEYFKAVEDQIEVMVVGRRSREDDGATPRPRNGAGPSPTPASANNAGGASGGIRKLTSIRQLSPREREVAQTMMRIGKLTEEQYLASYNSVRAAAEAHRRAVARTQMR